MSIQRYDVMIEWRGGGDAFAALGEADDGDVVLYEDHLAALTAERERADKYEKAAAHFNRLMLERGVDIENLTDERDALRERNARLVKALALIRDLSHRYETTLPAIRHVASTALEGK